MPAVSSNDFRIALESEVVPHKVRDDAEKLPYLYYVSYFVNFEAGSTASWRFIFAATTIETPRDITRLCRWVERYAGTANVALLAFHLVNEEVRKYLSP